MNGSVTALVIGDPHFKVSNVRETNAMVEAIVRVAQEKRPDIIVVLGDVLHQHESIHVSPLTRAIEFLARLMIIAPTYTLIGNHDLKNNRQFLSTEHPFLSLKHWGSNMTIVDITTIVNIKGQVFTFVPYVPPGRFQEALDTSNGTESSSVPLWESSTCIFAHQEFRGAQMGAIISTEGDEWPRTHPYVVTGHIHDYQEPQSNILYTGTPIQHAFGDRHDKSISYFTFISPTERLHERIDLGLPRKQIVYLTCGEVSTYVPQSNCELKIVIRGLAGEIKAILNHINIVAWKKAGYKIVYKDIPISKTGLIQYIIVDDKSTVSRAPARFSTVFYNSISDKPRLAPLYTRIFGSVKVDGGNIMLQALKNPTHILQIKSNQVNVSAENTNTIENTKLNMGSNSTQTLSITPMMLRLNINT